ncbi:MAG: hypothetical protein WBB48_11490 [Thermodesulfobacteriota bacterium]
MVRKNNLLSLFIILATICPAFLLQSCAKVNLKNNESNKNIIVRMYIGLSSNKDQEEMEIVDVENILLKHFDGATLQEANGFYKGQREKSLVITIINCCSWEKPREQFLESINNLVLQLRDKLGQESILVEYSSSGKTQMFEVLE